MKRKTKTKGPTKWYHLDPKKHGMGGLTSVRPARRKQDRRAKSWEGYAVVFFPKYKPQFKAACLSG